MKKNKISSILTSVKMFLFNLKPSSDLSLNKNTTTNINMPLLTTADGLYNYLITSNNEITIVNYLGVEATVVVPDSIDDIPVTTIGPVSFINNPLLKNISMSKVTTIDIAAFQNCTSLESVSIPLATTLGDNVFLGDTALKTLYMPKVITIGHSAFQNCSSLENISIPETTTIGANAFLNDISLKNIDMPNTKTIGANAFLNNIALKNVYMPKATTIDTNAFQNCSLL